MDNVGSRIKSLRKQKGYTLKDVSELAKISVSFLSDIENGRSKPSLERLMDIAHILDTSTAYLLGEETTNISNKKPNKLSEEFLDMLIKYNKIKNKEDLTPENIFSILNQIFKDIKEDTTK